MRWVFPVWYSFAAIDDLDGKGSREGALQEKTEESKAHFSSRVDL